MAIWSSGLGSPGFCSEMRFPALWKYCIKKCSYGVNREGCLRSLRRVIVFSMGPYSRSSTGDPEGYAKGCGSGRLFP